MLADNGIGPRTVALRHAYFNRVPVFSDALQPGRLEGDRGRFDAPIIERNMTAIDMDLLCPSCGYSLRGLTVHRCPECGGGFDLDALTAESENCFPGSLPWDETPESPSRSTYFQTLFCVLLDPGRTAAEFSRFPSVELANRFAVNTLLGVPAAIACVHIFTALWLGIAEADHGYFVEKVLALVFVEWFSLSAASLIVGVIYGVLVSTLLAAFTRPQEVVDRRRFWHALVAYTPAHLRSRRAEQQQRNTACSE